MTDEPVTVAVVELKVEPTYLQLSREARFEHWTRLQEIIRGHPGVEVVWHDADAISGDCSDFVICRFRTLFDYHCMWEEIKDGPLFSTPYFHITRVLIGMENAFVAYDEAIGI
ncbi:MAG: Darcynin 2 [Proteobacteria bacterium]|nr:Darcynin 2 [Pseudomonadota bacterium]